MSLRLQTRVDRVAERVRVRAPQDAETDTPRWTPYPGPQTQAYACTADVVGFGGAGGGGKTDLLVGKAFTKHHRAMLFRRQKTDELTNMVDRSRDIAPPGARLNETKLLWRGLPGGGVIGFGGLERPEDWKHYRGHGYDFFGFDEATEFLESQVRSLMGWNRTTKQGQACQVILTFNPPTSAEGEWIIRFFAPWLDPHHPNPAEPGEHRYFAMLDGEEREVETGEPFAKGGELITPKSRTFYPARVQDNPTLVANGYVATLQGLPEPLRSQVLYGDFTAGLEDDEWQVIPTRWVLAAQQRGQHGRRPEVLLTQLGIDVARGGRDRTVFARRYDGWLEPLLPLRKREFEGAEDGATVAKVAESILLATASPRALIAIDATGVGASPYDFLRRVHRRRVVGVIMAEGSGQVDASGRQRFQNTRSWLWWHMRELLDPDRGSTVALPDDPRLRADLCAPRWKPTVRGIAVESREDIVKRLGRSPDDGTACVLSFAPLVGGEVDRTAQIRVEVYQGAPQLDRVGREAAGHGSVDPYAQYAGVTGDPFESYAGAAAGGGESW